MDVVYVLGHASSLRAAAEISSKFRLTPVHPAPIEAELAVHEVVPNPVTSTLHSIFHWN